MSITIEKCSKCVYCTGERALPCAVNPMQFPNAKECRDFEYVGLCKGKVNFQDILDRFFPIHLHPEVELFDREDNCSFYWGNYTVLCTPERATLYTYDCGVYLDEDYLFVEYPHPFVENEDFPDASGDMTDDMLADELVADMQPMYWGFSVD
jgi:hypothetical protein